MSYIWTSVCVTIFMLLSTLVSVVFNIGGRVYKEVIMNTFRINNFVLISVSVLMLIIYFLHHFQRSFADVNVYNKIIDALSNPANPNPTRHSDRGEQIEEFFETEPVIVEQNHPREQDHVLGEDGADLRTGDGTEDNTKRYVREHQVNVNNDIHVPAILTERRFHRNGKSDSMSARHLLNAALPTLALWVFGAASMLYSALVMYNNTIKIRASKKEDDPEINMDIYYICYHFAKIIFFILHIAFLCMYREQHINYKHHSIFLITFLLATDFAVWIDSIMYSLKGHHLYPSEGNWPSCNVSSEVPNRKGNTTKTIKDLVEPFLFPFESKFSLILCLTLIKHLYKSINGLKSNSDDIPDEYISSDQRPMIAPNDELHSGDSEDWQVLDDTYFVDTNLTLQYKSKISRGCRMLFICIFNEYIAFVVSLFFISINIVLVLKYDAVICMNPGNEVEVNEDKVLDLNHMSILKMTYDLLGGIAATSLLVMYVSLSSGRSKYSYNSDFFILSFIISSHVLNALVAYADIRDKRHTFTRYSVPDAIFNSVQQTVQSVLLYKSYHIKLELSPTHRRLHNYCIKFMCVYNLCLYIMDSFLLYTYYELRPIFYQCYGNYWTVILHLAIPCAAFYRYHSMVLFLRKLAEY